MARSLVRKSYYVVQEMIFSKPGYIDSSEGANSMEANIFSSILHEHLQLAAVKKKETFFCQLKPFNVRESERLVASWLEVHLVSVSIRCWTVTDKMCHSGVFLAMLAVFVSHIGPDPYDVTTHWLYSLSPWYTSSTALHVKQGNQGGWRA